MKNEVKWQDIVRIKGEYHLETFDVTFEDERLNDIKLPDGESEILKK